MRACPAGLAGCVLSLAFSGETVSAGRAAGAVKCGFAGRTKMHTAPTIASSEMPAMQRLLFPKRFLACFDNMFFLR
jgi:hypothetical protein